MGLNLRLGRSPTPSARIFLTTAFPDSYRRISGGRRGRRYLRLDSNLWGVTGFGVLPIGNIRRGRGREAVSTGLVAALALAPAAVLLWPRLPPFHEDEILPLVPLIPVLKQPEAYGARSEERRVGNEGRSRCY